MANKKKGFVRLYRSLQDHWIWKTDMPFDDRSAWVDLIMMVNHEDKKIQVGRSIITIHAGQTWTSYQKLANRWKWSRERVYRYTKMLKSDGMIAVDATPNGTCLTLINYKDFAFSRNTDEATDEATGEATSKTTNEATDETQTRTIKNYKELKELKKKDPAPPRKGGTWQ